MAVSELCVSRRRSADAATARSLSRNGRSLRRVVELMNRSTWYPSQMEFRSWWQRSHWEFYSPLSIVDRARMIFQLSVLPPFC